MAQPIGAHASCTSRRSCPSMTLPSAFRLRASRYGGTSRCQTPIVAAALRESGLASPKLASENHRERRRVPGAGLEPATPRL